jgi:hypothetical protein
MEKLMGDEGRANLQTHLDNCWLLGKGETGIFVDIIEACEKAKRII